jgi:hypothetical protein
MTKLVVEIFDDGALSGTRPATQSEIDAAASDKFQRWARIGQAAEALMFLNGGFEAWHRRQDGMVGVMSVNKEVIGTGNDLDEALQNATKDERAASAGLLREVTK